MGTQYTAPTVLIVLAGNPAWHANSFTRDQPLLTKFSTTLAAASGTYHTGNEERKMGNRVLVRGFVPLHHVQLPLRQLACFDGFGTVLVEVVS